MSTLVTRAGKGSPLTHNEVDANFTNLNTDKVEKTSAAITGGTIDNTVIGATTPAAGTFTTLTATGQTSLGGVAGSESLRVLTPTLAGNYAQINTNNFGDVIFGNAGSGTNIPNKFLTKGSGVHQFATNNSITTVQFQVSHTASAVNYVQVTGGAAGATPAISIQGTGTNVNVSVSSKGTGAVRFFTNNTSQEQLAVSHTASAVNYVQVTGATTGNGTTISSQGSDANINMFYTAKGTGGHVFYTNAGVSGRQFDILHAASAVNRLTVTGASAGASPVFSVAGSDTNIDLNLTTKGTGTLVANLNSGYFKAYRDSGTNTVQLRSNGNLGLYAEAGGAILFNTNTAGDVRQMQVSHTASAVNYVQLTGNATTGAPTLSTQGSDANISLQYVAKGIGVHAFQTGASFNQFRITATNSSVNYIQVTGAATGVPVQLSAQGSDTNIPLVLQPKGTGALQAQQTDSTATGGNARGANAVDWQTARNSASSVASNINTVVGGGFGNTASGGYAVVAGGLNNTASGIASAITGGSSLTSSGTYSASVGGNSNTNSGYYGSLVGGQSNTSAGYYNFIGGGFTNSGTSGSAVTTQSATMNGTTAVTLSGSNANIKVGQLITGTSIAIFTYVAAISGTSLTLSQAASGSSTSTLSFYTPHGVVVGGGNNQATGAYSFIGAGGDAGTAANRNVASGDWSFVGGGAQNTASGTNASVLGGGNCSATSSFAVCLGGAGNTASGFGSTNLGGNGNVANGTYAVASGFSSTNRSLSTFAYAAGTASRNGDAQTEIFVLRNSTTDATATVLTLGASAPSTTNQVILPNNSAYTFRGEIVSGVTGGGNSKSWTIEGLIKRGANAASTTLVGSTVTSMFADVGAATWAIALSADTTNGGLAVTFTGQAATTIRTVCQIRTTEMTY